MPSVEIHPLTAERLHDYLSFFDTRAFTDNKAWSRCYCYFPYCQLNTQEWEARLAAENRESIAEFIQTDRAKGYLAYQGDDVVGWCNAAAFESFPILDELGDLDVDRAGAIVCFVVSPAHRGQGVAKSLLDAACEGLKAQGMQSIYAKPFKGAASTAENFPGPLSMYLAAGFQTVREDGKGNVIVRKMLA